jgi:hypothetical protein
MTKKMTTGDYLALINTQQQQSVSVLPPDQVFTWSALDNPPSLPKEQKQLSLDGPADLRKVICEHCGTETGETGTDPLGTCKGCQTLLNAGMSPGVAPPPLREARGEGADRARRPRMADPEPEDLDDYEPDDCVYEDEVDDDE